MADEKKTVKTENEPIKRNKNGTFAKGYAGGGRKPMPQDFKQACQEFTPKAIEILTSIANNEKQRANDRIKAIEVLLDRGYGKPVQAVDLNTQNIPQVVFVNEDKLKD